MDELTAQKDLIRKIVEHAMFNDMVKSLKQEMANDMLSADTDAYRQSIYYENKALDRLVGKLISITNEVRAIYG